MATGGNRYLFGGMSFADDYEVYLMNVFLKDEGLKYRLKLLVIHLSEAPRTDGQLPSNHQYHKDAFSNKTLPHSYIESFS